VIPIEVVEMFSGDHPELIEMRNRMPEPSRVPFQPGERFRVAKFAKPMTMYKPQRKYSVENISVKTEDWTKILVIEGKNSYWAWQHIATKLVFR